MKRKDFLKCTLMGGCACSLLSLGGNTPLSAQETTEKKQEIDPAQAFITEWVENLMLTMDKTLDENTRVQIMEQGGRYCARKSYIPIAQKYKGDIPGLLELMKKQWADSLDYNEKTGTINITNKKATACLCPLVKGRSTLKSGTYCYCSQGWVKEVFEIVSGKNVAVKIMKSILRGGDCCQFQITLS